MASLKTVILIVEADDGLCYQALLSKKQDSAIRSVLSALGENLRLIEDPLSMTISHNDDGILANQGGVPPEGN